MEYQPRASVTTPVEVPFTITVTPGIGEPWLSDTIPVTVRVCAGRFINASVIINENITLFFMIPFFIGLYHHDASITGIP
jgi:hypothetical protein